MKKIILIVLLFLLQIPNLITEEDPYLDSWPCSKCWQVTWGDEVVISRDIDFGDRNNPVNCSVLIKYKTRECDGYKEVLLTGFQLGAGCIDALNYTNADVVNLVQGYLAIENPMGFDFLEKHTEWSFVKAACWIYVIDDFQEIYSPCITEPLYCCDLLVTPVKDACDLRILDFLEYKQELLMTCSPAESPGTPLECENTCVRSKADIINKNGGN
jgi:hypothetical protein